uniref:Uncharacterized protein n=1 Tax=Anopheles minimus TaxID=112268 RepID=A0A182VW46_9DIPT
MQPTIPQSTGGSDMDLPAVQPMDWLFKKERIYLLAQFWQQNVEDRRRQQYGGGVVWVFVQTRLAHTSSGFPVVRIDGTGAPNRNRDPDSSNEITID